MLSRIVTSLVGLVIFFVILFAGSIPFNVGICVLIAIMLYELYKSTACHKALWGVGYVGAAVLAGGTMSGHFSAALFLTVALYLVASVALHGKADYKQVYTHGFLTVFVTVFMSALMEIRNGYGIYAVLIVFLCAWTTDTGAYFAGRFLGKHKLIPHVSPKKTVEGAIGGVICCMLCSALYLFILNRVSIASINGLHSYPQFMIVGAVGSVISQTGDLVASVIKRDCNVKDFGHILPGHGGILDRFDSVVFLAPFIYYLIRIVIGVLG